MPALLSFAFALTAAPALVGLALAWAGLRAPSGAPRSFPPGRGPLLCLGDSITHGRIGADWVSGLRRRGHTVCNAGWNGHLTWNVLQRFDAAAAVAPTAVFLLIGSNDVMAAERPERAAGYQRGNRLPVTPALPWSEAQLDALAARIAGLGVPWALGTIPPLGDDDDAPVAALVARWNDAVRAVATRHGGAILEVHDAVASRPGRRPYAGSLGALGRGIGLGLFRRHVLRRSWDAVGRVAGWARTIDGVHLDDTSAAAVEQLVDGWLRGPHDN